MADPRRHLTRLLRPGSTGEGDRTTNLELFFDLVYAFAFTQVTALISHETAPGSIIDGLIVLSLLWWSWCAFSWLANQARADTGFLQAAVIVAMVAIFIACLVLPQLFHDRPGQLHRAVVVIACYTTVRLTHFGAYLVAAHGDRRLLRQILVTVPASIIPTIGLLVAGAVAGPGWQRLLWLVAVGYDFAAVFFTGNHHIGWVIRSAAHFAERYSLIVILALGESIVAIAAGLGTTRFTWRIAAGAVLAFLIAVGLYLAYFPDLLDRLETAIQTAQGRARAKLGQDIYTFLHFPIIIGIILSAFGVEHAMNHLDTHHLGTLGGWTLGCGIALFLTATAAALARCEHRWPKTRLTASALLIGTAPLLATIPPLAAVGAAAAILLALAAIEFISRNQPAPTKTQNPQPG